MRRTKLRLGIFSLFMVFALILANCGVATTTETKQVNVLGKRKPEMLWDSPAPAT